MKTFARALYLTLIVGVLDFLAFFTSSAVFEYPGIIIVFIVNVYLLLWIWVRTFRMHRVINENSGQVSLPIKIPKWKKVVLVLALPIYLDIVLCVWWNMTDAWGSLEVTALFWLILAVIVGLCLALFTTLAFQTWKKMWVTTVILAGIFTILTIGRTGFLIIYSNYLDARYDREVKKVEKYTTVEQCGSIINNKILVYPHSGLNPTYYHWSKCIYSNFASVNDYPTCIDQAGSHQDYYRHTLKDDCEDARAAFQATSMADCAPLQPIGQSFPYWIHPNAEDICLKKFVTNEPSFTNCLQLLNELEISQVRNGYEPRGKYACYYAYLINKSDPKICDELYHGDGISEPLLSQCKRIGWTQ